MTLKNTYIADFQPGIRVDDIFALAEAKLLTAKNGPFWSLTLQDGSGRIPARIWSPQAQAYAALAPGQVARVLGRVETFREQNQLMVDSLEIIEEELDFATYSTLIPTSSRDPEELLAELEDILKSTLTFKPWKDLCRKVLNDEEIRWRLKASPGAKSIHHAYSGGLLEHTLAVCKMCMSIADLYDVVDKEILLVGAAFHDLGKAWEYSFGLTSELTDQGRLLGHIILGLEILSPFITRTKSLDPELAQHLKHIMVAHHGEYEFGSPKRPKTVEAFILHYADNLDAKIATVGEALSETDEEVCWSPYIRSLERFLFKARPTPTPGTNPADAKKPKKDDQQCLLPLKA